MAKTFVIIGAGAAGVHAARTLRQLDKEATIILLSEEHVLPYNKCLLTKVLAGQKTRESLFLYDAPFYTQQNITLILNVQNIYLQTHTQTVYYTVSGKEHHIVYTKLLLTYGVQPVTPFMLGEKCYTCHSLSDVDRLVQEITLYNTASCVIIGAGITGLECADALVKRGLHVTLVTKELMPAVEDEIREQLYSMLQKNGITIYTTPIKHYYTSNNKVTIELEDTTTITADFMLLTCGVTYKKIDADRTIQTHNNAILVDTYFQTKRAHVYAAGDCCIQKDNEYPYNLPFLWADAVTQGITAAKNMVGMSEAGRFGSALTITNIAGIPIVLYGITKHTPTIQKIERISNDSLSLYYAASDGILCGFVLFNTLHGCALLKKAVEQKTPYHDVLQQIVMSNV